MTTYDSIRIENPNGSGSTGSADDLSMLSDGCGQTWEVKVPRWHNDVRYYRDVCGYAVRVTHVSVCAFCGGSGTVPYAQDRRKPTWAQRTKRCPEHVETVTTDVDPSIVPTLADCLTPAR